MIQDETQAYIPVTVFKDKLLLPHSYKRDTMVQKPKKVKADKPLRRGAGYGDTDDDDADGDQSDSSSDASVGINAILENR
jgi:hypothetical protein